MLSHVIDHFIFSSKRLSFRTKAISFGIIAGLIIVNFWWFRGVAFGIDGPINQHRGLKWRDVSLFGLNSELRADIVDQSWNIYEPGY